MWWMIIYRNQWVNTTNSFLECWWTIIHFFCLEHLFFCPIKFSFAWKAILLPVQFSFCLNSNSFGWTAILMADQLFFWSINYSFGHSVKVRKIIFSFGESIFSFRRTIFSFGALTPSLPWTYVSRHVLVHPVCLGRDIYVMYTKPNIYCFARDVTAKIFSTNMVFLNNR